MHINWEKAALMAIGAMDTLTGFGLVLFPAQILWQLGLAISPTPIWLRWIGVFVASVGLMYFLPFFANTVQRPIVMRTILWATMVPRTGVALFLAFSMLNGLLPLAWWSVAVVDAGTAICQFIWLRIGVRP